MSFTDDLALVDRNTIETTGPMYPVAQWHNGDPKLVAVGGVAHTGGVYLPQKYLPNDLATPPGWASIDMTFASGDTERGLAAQKVKLAVIRARFRWFSVVGGLTNYYPRNSYKADSGMRGQLQALCGIPGFDFPVVVSFKGKASQEFDKALRDFTAKITDAAKRIGGKDAVYPRFAFFLRLQPAAHTKVGPKNQESIVTPPVMLLPEVIDADYLSKVYVGKDKLMEWQVEYHAADEWAVAWDKGATDAEEYQGDPEAEAPQRQPVMAPVQTGAQALGTEAHFGNGKAKTPPPPPNFGPDDDF